MWRKLDAWLSVVDRDSRDIKNKTLQIVAIFRIRSEFFLDFFLTILGSRNALVVSVALKSPANHITPRF